MSKRITAVALAVLMLALALPANAAIQATSLEVRGAIAEPSTTVPFRPGVLASDINATWTPYNFAGFYYDLKNDLGTETLRIAPGDLAGNSRTIQLKDLTYQTAGQPKGLYAVQNGKSDGSDGGPLSNGLQKFAAGQMSALAGSYNVVGWQAMAYVGVKNHSYKLSKLIIEQQNSSSDKKTMTVGDTWDIGGGWTLTANSIDAKASPRQVWLTLSKDGVKKDDNVVQQGQIYTYVEKNIGGESDVPLFLTFVDSVFAGATSDMVQLRYTWAIDTSITELKGGDVYGVFKVQATEPIILQNTDNTVTLSRDTRVNLMGNMNFVTADSDT
ncbi:MAG: S-layer protein domain-containing protein, partial [Candidatus Methanoperedens sp.]|nr:S-layer protein domain-containing protein [Candidatus Methanoperedens sp.]